MRALLTELTSLPYQKIIFLTNEKASATRQPWMRRNGDLPLPRCLSHSFTRLGRESNAHHRPVHEPVETVHNARQSTMDRRPERYNENGSEDGQGLEKPETIDETMIVAASEGNERDEATYADEPTKFADRHDETLL